MKISDYSCGIIPLFLEDGVYKLFMIMHKNGNFWCFPKGHKEGSEDKIAAAKRELYEETRLEVLSLVCETPFVEKYQYQRGCQFVNKTVEYYLAFTTSHAAVDESELLEGRWVSLDSAEKLATYEEGKALCRQIVSYIKENILQ